MSQWVSRQLFKLSIFKCDSTISFSKQGFLSLYLSSITSYMILPVYKARNLPFFCPHLEPVKTLSKSSSKKSPTFTLHSISTCFCLTSHPYHFSNQPITIDIASTIFTNPFYTSHLFNFCKVQF